MVISDGGLGHMGVQCLAALTATTIVVVDRNRTGSSWPSSWRASHTMVADGGTWPACGLTGGAGGTWCSTSWPSRAPRTTGWAMTGRQARLRHRLGGTLHIPTLDIITTERNIIGNIVGAYNDLAELMVLAQAGKVTLHTRTYPLEAAPEAMPISMRDGFAAARSSSPSRFAARPSRRPGRPSPGPAARPQPDTDTPC